MKVFLVINKKNRPTAKFLKLLQKFFIGVDQPKQAEMIIVLGGDGTMLHAIKNYRSCHLPFIGFNFGHLGFLMNAPTDQAIAEAASGKLIAVEQRLLQATFHLPDGTVKNELAFNDFYFERTTSATARVRVAVNEQVLFDPLVADGVIVASAAGSTAYNASAGGTILPLGVNSLVVTGICPAVFHRWRSAQLDPDSQVMLEPLDIGQRPVRFLADGREIANVIKAEIGYSQESVRLLFVASSNFRQKRLDLQFGRA
jgi:NAD+ kinase